MNLQNLQNLLTADWVSTNLLSTFSYWQLVKSLAIFTTLLGVFWFSKKIILWRIKNWIAQTSNDYDDLVYQLLRSVNFWLFALVALGISVWPLLNSSSWQQIIALVIWIAGGWQTVLLGQKIISFVSNKIIERQNQSTRSVVKTLATIVKYSLWFFAGLLVFSNLGINVTSLVAGLGVSGIVVAFALQNVLADLFSSLSIHFDQPFGVGDFIVIGEQMGTVEKIGLKSTRIRSLSGEEIIIPNQELTNAQLKNYRSLERRRVEFSFGVGYDTSNIKLKQIPTAIEKIVSSLDQATFSRAHLVDFADFALVFKVVYFVEQGDYKLYRDLHQQVLLELKAYLEAQKITIPYPTQTVRVAK